MAKGMMGEVKIKHEGGDRSSKPTSGATHKEQKPGVAAGGTCTGSMSWSGSHMHKDHHSKYAK